VMEASKLPQLISTNRHMTQGWVDIKSISYDSKRQIYTGRSQIIAGDPYVMSFAVPPGKKLEIKNATAEGLKVSIKNHDYWSQVKISSPETKEVEWQVTFGDAVYYEFPVYNIRGNLTMEETGEDTYKLSWPTNYWNHSGYYIYLDDELKGVSLMSKVLLQGFNIQENTKIEVSTVWYNGSESEKRVQYKKEEQ